MKLKLKSTQSAAFTWKELLLVTGLVCMLSVIILSGYKKAKARRSSLTCINQVQQICLAFKQWSLDNDDQFPMERVIAEGGAKEGGSEGEVWRVFQVASNELNRPGLLICSAETEKRRTRATSFASMGAGAFAGNSNVSYFLNLNARAKDEKVILLGDSCLTVKGVPVAAGLLPVSVNEGLGWQRPLRRDHDRGGNIGMSDGSVARVSDKELRALVRQMENATNLWAIP